MSSTESYAHTSQQRAIPPDLESLMTPWKIGSCEIKNRVVLTSMGGTNLFGWMEKHHFDEMGAHFIQEVAEHDAGLVLPGCQPVLNPMYGKWLYENEAMFDDLARWLPGFHKTGAKLFVQLTAGFGRVFTISKMMETLYTSRILRFLSKPVMDLDRITAAPSPLPNRWSDKVSSRPLTVEEIHQMVEAFAKSAKLLQEAGVDGVEVHAVHEGYLLDQFTHQYTNYREDEYGGSFENRYRFAVEIVQAIKAACGPDFPVSLRYSVVSKTKGFRRGALPGEENYIEVGRDLEESKRAAKYLQDAGYDMLNCDNGTYDAWYWAHPPIYMPKNCNLEDVSKIKPYVDIPVIAAGRMDPRDGSRAIAEGKIDAVGFARRFLADPAWLTKLLDGKEEEIRPCILCHNACFNMSSYKGVPNDQDLYDSLHLSRCAVNAEMMQWDRFKIEPARHPKRVHIVGGGVGGMEAARVLALRGHKPVIYEKSDVLGGVVIPGGAESYKKVMHDLLDWYRLQMEKLNVEIHFNEEIQSDHDFGSDPLIIATGSEPIFLSNVPGFTKAIEAQDFLNGAPVGEFVAVIGGSLTGCEIAYELVLQGKKPCIIEMKDDLIATKGVCLANSSFLREFFQLHEVPVYLESVLTEVKDDAIIYRDKTGLTHEVLCDSVISAVGYRPAPLKIQGRDPYIVGDCLEVGNLRTVIWRAYEVAMRID